MKMHFERAPDNNQFSDISCCVAQKDKNAFLSIEQPFAILGIILFFIVRPRFPDALGAASVEAFVFEGAQVL
jgi:hypothetical protein